MQHVDYRIGIRRVSASNDAVWWRRQRGRLGWLVVNGVAFLPWLLVLVPGAVLGRRIASRVRRRLPVARAMPGVGLDGHDAPKS